MHVLFVAVVIAHLLWAGAQLARRLLPGLPAADAWVLGAGTALGAYTWLLTWVALLPGRPLDGWGPLAVYALVAGAGHRARHETPEASISWDREASIWSAPVWPASVWSAWLVLAVFVAGAAYTALAVPATHWDFLYRYGLHSLLMHDAGALVPQVQGYPPLVSMFGAAVYAGLGRVDEGLAKLHAVIYLGLVLALTYRLALRPRRPWVARAAVLLFGLAPIVLNSPPCGDPDLALTFHATACLYLLLSESGDAPARMAVACGLQLGLALWAKQAAAPFAGTLVALGALAAVGWLRHGWLSARRLALALAVALALAAPWYLRNLSLGGPLTELANPADSAHGDRGLASLLFARWHEELGVFGAPAFLLGLLALLSGALAPGEGRPRIAPRALALALAACAGLALLRPKPPFDRYAAVFGGLAALALCACARPLGLEPRATIALAYVLPLLLVWWARFAFTARYLMPVLPVLACAGAAAGARALGPVLRRSPGAWALLLPLVALVTLETAPVWRRTLAQAWGSRGRSREQCFSEVYPGAVYRVAMRLAREGVSSARVATNDTRLAYFLVPPRPPLALPRAPSDLASVDVVVVGPYGDSVDASAGEVEALRAAQRALLGPPWFSEDRCDVYRVRR